MPCSLRQICTHSHTNATAIYLVSYFRILLSPLSSRSQVLSTALPTNSSDPQREESFQVMLVPFSTEYSWLLWWTECLLGLLARTSLSVTFFTLCSTFTVACLLSLNLFDLLPWWSRVSSPVHWHFMHLTTSDQGTHFMDKEGRQWTGGQDSHWPYHILNHPEIAA